MNKEREIPEHLQAISDELRSFGIQVDLQDELKKLGVGGRVIYKLQIYNATKLATYRIADFYTMVENQTILRLVWLHPKNRVYSKYFKNFSVDLFNPNSLTELYAAIKEMIDGDYGPDYIESSNSNIIVEPSSLP